MPSAIPSVAVPSPQPSEPSKNILLGVTGGIAAYKSAVLVRRLKDAGFAVRVIMTAGAQAFVTPLTFQALSGEPVHTSLLDPEAEAGMGHIQLARWADLVLVAPASANAIARIAAGAADDLLTTVILATAAPVLISPAMNQQMWQNSFVQRNLKTLRDYGIRVVDPNSGSQACGDIGAGRMPEPEELVVLVQQHFKNQSADVSLPDSGILAGKHVVITAGPTREALDPVRYVSNHSSGKMGFALAEACRDAGARVTLLAGPVSLATPQGVTRINVVSARDLLAASEQAVDAGCDVFIATAAVADYRAEHIAEQKIKKQGDSLTLTLVKNPDIVASIALHAKRPFMVGFAAETQYMEEYARGKLERKQLDMIACNDVSRGDIGFASDDNAMTVFFSDRFGLEKVILEKANKHVIATRLVECLVQAGINDQNH
ncbi:bifunctional phosphopantothenoylcysteine decarboxylase/phosphopantothenate--cysteine ligase CoaBC [Aquirhabdus sp.]|uniref:bifunctional phosphopantothenoylcysteine decarboxylase/phosphopantothenate--cysteine ligase CoaBC n=1 Tax=Aquirhabdus sp. TaxID=2824160 RepID=UPI00396CD3F1